MLYNLLGRLTWKAMRYYVRSNVPTRKIAVAAIVGMVGAVAIGAALKGRDSET